MAGLKKRLAAVLIGLCLAGFGLWQWRENIRKESRLEAQAQSLERLGRLAQQIDQVLVEWRTEHAAIADRRQATRERTREAARNDPAFQEFLAAPLPSALRPGGGLLGGQSDRTPGPAPSAPAPDADP